MCLTLLLSNFFPFRQWTGLQLVATYPSKERLGLRLFDLMHNEPMIKAIRSVTILFYAYQLHSRHLRSKETVHSSMLVKLEAYRPRHSPGQQFPTLFEQVHSSSKRFPLSSRID